jgi:FlaA1/EpsC-like NDP-sugar epimerase
MRLYQVGRFSLSAVVSSRTLFTQCGCINHTDIDFKISDYESVDTIHRLHDGNGLACSIKDVEITDQLSDYQLAEKTSMRIVHWYVDDVVVVVGGGGGGGGGTVGFLVRT